MHNKNIIISNVSLIGFPEWVLFNTFYELVSPYSMVSPYSKVVIAFLPHDYSLLIIASL